KPKSHCFLRAKKLVLIQKYASDRFDRTVGRYTSPNVSKGFLINALERGDPTALPSLALEQPGCSVRISSNVKRIAVPAMNMDLAADLRSYATGRRDSKKEQSLLRRIRALPQAQRMEPIALLLNSHCPAALSMADRVQLRRGDYVLIFKRGLAEANASSIKLWIRATVRHIGWRTVISILRDVAAPWPSPGAFALYHMPFLFPGYPLPSSLKQDCVQLLELYEREKPLPFLPASWQNRDRGKTKQSFMFVWSGRQIRSSEMDSEK